jgi:hypothetical protein
MISRHLNNASESNFTIGYCVGGHQGDPAPNQDGGIRVYQAHHMGNDVSKDHIGFSPVMMQPNQGGATEFNGCVDPGQALVCMRTKEPDGASSLVVIGCLQPTRQDGGSPQNSNLNTLNALVAAFATTTGVLPAPNVKETVIGGARVRIVQEKGFEHKHDLLRGIPSSGSMYPLAGLIQKQITGISTATQSFSNIITGSMMAALPGTNFSLGSLLTSLTSSALDEILSSMPVEIAQGTQSMFNLMQSMEVNESGGFNTMGKVDPTTFLTNATNLLKGNQSLGEVVENVKRLQYDASLFGLDKLGSASFDIPTAFGVIKMSLSPTGQMINETPEPVQKAIDAFSSLMTSGAGFPSGSLTNMFGSSASVMSSLFDRLPPDKQTNAKNMMEGVIAPGTKSRDNLNKLSRAIGTGVNLLSLPMFK